MTVLFFIVSLVVLEAYQNPVNYIDSVDVIQANVGNQKFSEWITANDADIDTLEADMDSVEAEVDTLLAHKDSLHARMDSIQTSRDSVFDAYDAAGGEAIGTSQEERINLDTETREDAIYVHGADAYGVEIVTAGWYRVNYDVSILNSDGTVAVLVYAYLKKYNASWANVAGTRSYGNLTASASSTVLLTAIKRIEFAAGDSICLTVFNNSATDGIETVANSVRLGIEKLH